MKRSDLEMLKEKLPLSADTLALNPVTAEAHNAPQVGHGEFRPFVIPCCGPEKVSGGFVPGVSSGIRIRQETKPAMNKLEAEWFAVLKKTLPAGTRIHAQEWRVKIANGSWFKVDFCAVVDGQWTAWECKGPKQGKNVARGLLALKCAASAFPEVRWVLVWKENGRWLQQEILP